MWREDIQNDLYAMVVLPDRVIMFPEIGEHKAKECNVSHDRVFVSVIVIVVVSLGAKLAQVEDECWTTVSSISLSPSFSLSVFLCLSLFILSLAFSPLDCT